MDFKKFFHKDTSPTNPHLEKAAHAVALADNEKTRRALYDSLLKSTLIIPGSVVGGTENTPGEHIAGENTQIRFRTVEHPLGNIVLPVFTDIAALKDWHQREVPWVAMAAPALFEAVAKTTIDEIRINPFRPEQEIKRPGGVVTRVEFQALAQGMMPEKSGPGNVMGMRIEKGQKVLLGLPAQAPPPELLAELGALFEVTQELQAAYLFQMAHGNNSSTVIGLHFVNEPNDARMRELMGGFAAVIRKHLKRDQHLDFMSLQDPKFREGIERSGKPIFKRPSVS
jgi:hypothetical protein